MSNERYPDPTEIRHTIGAQGTFALQSVSGEVELRATDGDEVVVHASSWSGRGDDLPLIVNRSEGALRIDVEKRTFDMFGSFFRGNDGIQFSVELPRNARVEIKTVSADVSAHFLAGEQTYKTVSGDIAVDPSAGRLELSSVSGDISLLPTAEVVANIDTTSGDVTVRGGTLSALNVRTVSGDVNVDADVAAGTLHSVETVSGDLAIESPTGISVEVRRAMDMGRRDGRTLVAGDGSARLRFRTLSGDVHVAGAERRSAHTDDEHDDYGRRGRGRLGRSLGRHIEREVKRSLGSIVVDLGDSPPPAPPTTPPAPPREPRWSQLDVLQALERGEIDVDEASRRLQEVE